MPYSIGSILQQTFQDFEVLVVGDGCTDNSEDVVNTIGDVRVRWLNLPENSGHQSSPNNEGLRQARGEFIAYLGHDDLWLPHHLTCLTEALTAGADLAYALTMMVGSGNYDTRPIPVQGPYRPGTAIPPTGVVHRRCVIEKVGGWKRHRELRIAPDTDFWKRIYESGYRFTFVPRLTAVKFPAAWRRDVYRERPHHEQAAWLNRIQNQKDFEAIELVKMLSTESNTQAFWHEEPFPRLLRKLWQETLRRCRNLLTQKGAYIEARRQLKGLEPQPPLRQ